VATPMSPESLLRSERRDLLQRNSRYASPIQSRLSQKWQQESLVTALQTRHAVEACSKSFWLQRQKCSATSRVYVESTVALIIESSAQRPKRSFGDPRKSDVFVGPLIDRAALAKFTARSKTSSDGGTVVAGDGAARRCVEQGMLCAPTS